MHAGTRSVVAKAMRIGYYWPTMHKDARKVIRECQDCQVHHPVPRNPQQRLTPITSPWPFYKWVIDVAGPFPDGLHSRRFGLRGKIISDNGKQFRDNPFKDWCEKLNIRQRFASIKHPKDWIEEIPHVLWAHRTMIKSSNGDTLFSLTYGTKAVIPAKIDIPTLRTTEIDMVQNDEAPKLNLDLLEEKGRDLVYQNNDASHAEDGGKLGPKGEGPYEVIEALGKGAYKLKDRNGKLLPRTWNVRNLKNCYIHEM
ncbi:reverse transcriptase domain-containing protein [Tanacetum coccineum]